MQWLPSACLAKAPKAELFRDPPFGPDAIDASGALLNALVASAARSRARSTPRPRVPRRTSASRFPTIGHYRAALPDADDRRGLVQVGKVTTLGSPDPQVRAQIERARAGLAENRARRLSIGFLGEGTRDAAISKIAAAP